MTFSEVKQLLDAGFTKDEIMAFETPAAPAQISTPAQIPETDPASTTASTPAQVSETDPVNTPAPVPAQVQASTPAQVPETDPAISALNENISKLIRTIQSSNLRTASMDKPSEEDITSKVDKIMQGIIRPDINKGG